MGYKICPAGDICPNCYTSQASATSVLACKGLLAMFGYSAPPENIAGRLETREGL
jgi:hypothetical protein